MIEEEERLYSFFQEQKRHWQRLLRGKIPEKNIIKGWIESCDLATEDFSNIVAVHSLEKAADVLRLT